MIVSHLVLDAPRLSPRDRITLSRALARLADDSAAVRLALSFATAFRGELTVARA